MLIAEPSTQSVLLIVWSCYQGCKHCHISTVMTLCQPELFAVGGPYWGEQPCGLGAQRYAHPARHLHHFRFV